MQAADCGVPGGGGTAEAGRADYWHQEETVTAGAMHEQAVDHSPQDFHRSLAAISTAAQSAVRVRHEGDTTVVTEHRDPYSFYWQLDRFRRPEPQLPAAPPGPPMPPPQSDVDLEETVLHSEQVQSPDSHDSGIQVEQQPAPPRRPMPAAMQPPPQEEQDYSHYWHVDPLLRDADAQADEPIRVVEKVVEVEKVVAMPTPAPVIIQQQPVIEEHAFKQTTTKRTVDDEHDRQDTDEYAEHPVRFAVRSLGWTEIGEEELTPERSSRAVNKAIVDLATGRNDLLDNVAKWGDGKELIMELDDRDLRLVDPDSGAPLHTQAIHQIRVWGVGRDNARDFAYVARDRSTRRFMCHVFRCDTPARTIANTLRDICRRLMAERRPASLPAEPRAAAAEVDADYGTGRDRHRQAILPREQHSFPAPMEEPKKVIRCHFLGVTQVPKATGIEILNDAVDRLVAAVRPERWILADVAIAPSTIVVHEVGGAQIAECRIRYLSFLGIGRDIKSCAYIMHTSAENFMCYVFHVEPSAGAMAKTIEAACKLRYQKVLDAHHHSAAVPQPLAHHHAQVQPASSAPINGTHHGSRRDKVGQQAHYRPPTVY